MQDDAVHPYNNCARNQTTSARYILLRIDVFFFVFFFPYRSVVVPNLHDDRESVMATFNWQWPVIRWPNLVAAGEGPTSLCPQRATAATCTNVTHRQLHAACYQLKA
jgi:hypothetical protein